MDNQADVLDKWSRLLEGDGYSVSRAATLEEAETLLRSEWIQLAVLDTRMLDEDDENDISGLRLAQRPEFDAVPKIVLTAYPTYVHTRQVLTSDESGRSAALNYIAKEEGPQALREAIGKAFAEQIRTNWELSIDWDQRQSLGFLYLASLLEPDLPHETLRHRADELEDLFRRAFREYRRIRICRLLWHADRRVCLSVLTQTPRGATNSQILVCGERTRILREQDLIQELAPDPKPGKVGGTAATMHFHAITHVLLNTDIETVQVLREAFEGSQERVLRRALDHLLKDVLGAWHRRGERLEEAQDLMSLYRQWVRLEEDGAFRAEVARRVEALLQATRSLSAVEIERGPDQSIVFHFPSQQPIVCPDPVETVNARLEQCADPVVCKVSPGRLTSENVLVDASQQTWLTDLLYAGQAPQWWDYICLEAALRFDLGRVPDLLALLGLEECLTTPDTLLDRLRAQDVIPSARTAVNLIEQIRRQAASETGHNPLPYYAGLLAWAVRGMADYDPDILYTHPERMRGAHLLLAAAMIAKRLGETIRSAPPEGRLRLKEDGTVWIGGHRAGTLVGQELALLCRLFEAGGRTLSRQAIVESVFEEKYIAGDKYQETRINTLVKRLRNDVEPDPAHPRYVLTVRGEGYRLYIEGRLDK